MNEEKSENSHQHHDGLFKKMMQNLDVAKDFFRGYLPDIILSEIDLDSLVIKNPEHISRLFNKRYSDMIFSADFHGRTGFLMLMVENQAEPEKHMVFRFWEYCTLAWRKHLKNNENEPFPVIVPLLFYTGKRRYPYSTSILDLFRKEDQKLARLALLRPVQLIDLQCISDDEIRQHGKSSVQEILYKYRYDSIEDILPLATQQFVENMPDDDSGYQDVLEYIYSLDDNKDIDTLDKAAKKIASELPKNLGDTLMTYAQQYENRGRQEGREETKIEAAKRMLAYNMPLDQIADILDMSEASLKLFSLESGD